jgi:FAD/FMN-containing dehydrogenase
MKYLELEYRRPGLDLMCAMKRTVDPLNIMNPGRILKLSEHDESF